MQSRCENTKHNPLKIISFVSLNLVHHALMPQMGIAGGSVIYSVMVEWRLYYIFAQ